MTKPHIEFLGIGPQRTGTTWLEKILRSHRQLCLPMDVKETRFFDLHYENGLDWYLWHFQHCQNYQHAGEVAPTYFDSDKAFQRIRQHYPNIKIIITLRDPISRVFSLYRHHIYRGHASGSFLDVAKSTPHLMNSGQYAKYIPQWRDQYKENLEFILFDDIEKNPQQVLNHLCEFLGVDRIPLPQNSKERVSVMSAPKSEFAAKAGVQFANALRKYRLHKIVEFSKKLGLNKFILEGGKKEIPELSTEEKKWILEYHEGDISYVENLLQRDLSQWRKIEQ